MPMGISLWLVLFLILEFYYFLIDYFTLGLFAHYGYTIGSLGTVSYLLITVFVITIVIAALSIIIYGFINRTLWARKFAMLYIVWAMLWPIWGIVVGNNVMFHIILLLVYIASIIYLMTRYVIVYLEEIDFFKWGEYTLYKKIVTLKSGKTVTIHFFSKHEPKSGTPTTMPEGYEVGVNQRSNMPYLQKIGKAKPYMHGDYTLYCRDVTLKSGKSLTIHFFSKRKPKSGKPTTLPDGYIVGINQRSKLPYLKKKDKKPVTKDKEEVKVVISNGEGTEAKHRKPSNVIYVISKPQPGQVKGDWAVRSHGKIFSHHRTKANAIKEARKVASTRDATVLIQNTDGTFSKGFKPKSIK